MKEIDTPDWLSFFGADFSAMMPEDWQEQVEKLVLSSAKSTILDGASETSREGPGTRIPVKVVEGKAIQDTLPWLVDLYEQDFRAFAMRRFGSSIYRCNDANDAININCIEGVAARYEWHVDTNPVTGILFLDTFDEEDGGALIFRHQGETYRFLPMSGWFCCFAAQTVEHAVEPLAKASRRISIPMNYYLNEDNSGRDPALKGYLANDR